MVCIGRSCRQRKIDANGVSIEVLQPHESIAYLGRQLCLTTFHETELENRIAKAWVKFNMNRGALCDRRLPVKMRMKFFDTIITPSVLYACGAWVMTAERSSRLQSTQRRMLRSMLGWKWVRESDDEDDWLPAYVEWIRDVTRAAVSHIDAGHVADWVREQRKRYLTWSGHCARRTDGRWTLLTLTMKVGGERAQGHPVKRWSDSIDSFLRKTI